MKRTPFALVLILLLVPGCHRFTASADSGDPASPAVGQQAHAAGKFDFYLLNLSWSPEFCHSHPTALECAQHSTFVLHGMWPQNNDGSYPQHCSSAPGPADPSQPMLNPRAL